jgi:hypothetical protein
MLRQLAISAAIVWMSAGSGVSQTVPAPIGETGWREDLKVFQEKFGASGTVLDFQRGPRSRGQRDFERLYPPSIFHAEMGRLESELRNLSDDEVALALMKLVASANVAHTSVSPGLRFHFFGRLPLTLFWYPDGPAVIEASAEYSNAIGSRLVRIGTMTPDEVLAAVGPFVGRETDTWQQLLVPQYLMTRAMLDHLGLLGPDLKVSLTLQKPGSDPFTIDVRIADPRTPKLNLADVLHVDAPLYLSQPKSYYWYRYLPDSQPSTSNTIGARTIPICSLESLCAWLWPTQTCARLDIWFGEWWSTCA